MRLTGHILPASPGALVNSWPRPTPDVRQRAREIIHAWLRRMTAERGAQWAHVRDEDVEVLVHDVSEISAVADWIERRRRGYSGERRHGL